MPRRIMRSKSLPFWGGQPTLVHFSSYATEAQHQWTASLYCGGERQRLSWSCFALDSLTVCVCVHVCVGVGTEVKLHSHGILCDHKGQYCQPPCNRQCAQCCHCICGQHPLSLPTPNF